MEVDVPNTNTKLPFQAYEVDKIVLSSTIQPEVVNYTLTGGSHHRHWPLAMDYPPRR